MSDLLAPPAIALRRRSTLGALALDPARELGAGGEARVLAVPGDDSLVAKLYHEPTLAKARKVALMMEEPPELDASAARLAWPCDLLFDGSGAFAGFLMPRVEGPRVFELYNPVTRRAAAPHADYAFLHRAAANLAAAFEALHARGYVIGDVNESNVLVGDDASVTLVDTDSMQVRDPEDGAVHRSRVGKPEFTPPELQGRSFADFDRSPENDRFGFAVLLFLLLMEGTHPFAGRLDDGGEMPPIEERIRRGLFPHDDHAEIRPPRLAPDFSLLAHGVRALFVRCFEDGHADPAARPTAAEWRAALAEAEAKLVTCDVNPRHRHGRHLGACPWCARMAVLRVPDPFPADVDLAPGKPARVPARRIAPAPSPSPRSTLPPASKPIAPRAAAGTPKPPVPAQPAAPAPISVTTPATSAPQPAAAPPPVPSPPLQFVDPPIPAWGSALADRAREIGERTGLLHPGVWVGPALVLALGPWMLMPLGMIAFPLLLIATLIEVATGSKRWKPENLAVAASLLLILAVILTSALGGSWFRDRLANPPPPPSYEPAPVVRGDVRIGPPITHTLDETPILANHGSILFRLRQRYPSSPDGKARRLGLRVYVRDDGTVDPQATEIRDSDDGLLADVVSDVAREMVFVPLRDKDGWPRSDFVWMEISYVPGVPVQ